MAPSDPWIWSQKCLIHMTQVLRFNQVSRIDQNICRRQGKINLIENSCPKIAVRPPIIHMHVMLAFVKKQGEIKFILTNTVDSFIKVLSVTYTFSNIGRFHLHIYQHGIYRKQQVIEK